MAALSGMPGRMCVCVCVCVVMCTRKNMCLWSGILVRTCVCDHVYQEEHVLVIRYTQKKIGVHGQVYQ